MHPATVPGSRSAPAHARRPARAATRIPLAAKRGKRVANHREPPVLRNPAPRVSCRPGSISYELSGQCAMIRTDIFRFGWRWGRASGGRGFRRRSTPLNASCLPGGNAMGLAARPRPAFFPRARPRLKVLMLICTIAYFVRPPVLARCESCHSCRAPRGLHSLMSENRCAS